MLRIRQDGHVEQIVEAILADNTTFGDPIRISGRKLLDATADSPRVAAAIACAFLLAQWETVIHLETKLIVVTVTANEGMYEIRTEDGSAVL